MGADGTDMIVRRSLSLLGLAEEMTCSYFLLVCMDGGDLVAAQGHAVNCVVGRMVSE